VEVPTEQSTINLDKIEPNHFKKWVDLQLACHPQNSTKVLGAELFINSIENKDDK